MAAGWAKLVAVGLWSPGAGPRKQREALQNVLYCIILSCYTVLILHYFILHYVVVYCLVLVSGIMS